MDRLKYIVLTGALCGLSACQSHEWEVADDTDRRIYLKAQVENASVQSRVPYELTAPTLVAPLEVDVWASTTTNKFENGKENGSNEMVSYHTTARFTNAQEQLLDDVIYPKENTVYFVGMHPKGWTTTDGTSASYVFSGKDDVMFVPQIEGRYAENATPEYWPTLTFKHLLTWLRIEMAAESEAVRNAWGKVKKLTIKSRSKVTVDLGRTYVDKKHDDGADATVNFTGEEDLSFYQTGTDDVFPKTEGYTLELPKQDASGEIFPEVAYVLCAPVNATEKNVVEGVEEPTDEYTLTVITEKRTVNLSIDLKSAADTYFKQSTMGHQFTLRLRFKMGDNISVSAVATDWINGGIGKGDFDENSLNSK